MADNPYPPATQPPKTAAGGGFVTVATNTLPKFRPFPVNSLPPDVGAYAHHAADVLNVDTSMVALPILAALAAIIGNTRTIRITADWFEASVIWAAIVARSGELKSPALRKATSPISKLNKEAIIENQRQAEIYNAELDQYNDQLRIWKSGKSNLPKPTEPTAPIRKRHVVGDITTEALVPMLADNPRGLLLLRDELAGFFGGMNAYKKSGSDEQQYLEMFNAGTICVDRKTDLSQTIVDRAAVSITGTIQPGVLRNVLSDERMQSGMAARFLFAQPPERIRKRPTNSIPPHVKAEAEEVFRNLSRFEMHTDDFGNAEPVQLVMDDKAEESWWQFYEIHSYRMRDESDDDLRSALSKLEAYCARFALVIHCCLNASNPHNTAVDVGTIESAEEITKWCIDETRRVYGHLRESDQQRNRRELIDHIQEKGGTITVRELQRGPRQFRGAGKAESALEGLVADEVACRLLLESTPVGGRPTYSYQLNF